jgi:hypothetical protein
LTARQMVAAISRILIQHVCRVEIQNGNTSTFAQLRPA